MALERWSFLNVAEAFHASLEAAQNPLREDGTINTRNMDSGICFLTGMSGVIFRVWLNTLIGAISDARYLEVGTYTGSTLCAAINNNKVKATSIDDHSQHWHWRNEDIIRERDHNLARFQVGDCLVKLMDFDFRNIFWDGIGKHNVYLFDGPHEEQDQYDGIKLALPALEKEFVLIVDDWNDAPVKRGTERALQDCNLAVKENFYVNTNIQDHVIGAEWHNGYFCAVIEQC